MVSAGPRHQNPGLTSCLCSGLGNRNTLVKGQERNNNLKNQFRVIVFVLGLGLGIKGSGEIVTKCYLQDSCTWTRIFRLKVVFDVS